MDDLHDPQPEGPLYQAPEPVSSDQPGAAAIDPRQEMESRNHGDGDAEAPTCRVCRGEETPEEPLFFPCKCNGSIRFVHQACLMEWLARSQKRHCELCKTPFRFTKLYDPQMPPTVPFPVFIKQAFYQVGNGILRVLRYILVAFVWLCWVPWTMRTMWRFLFWLGDGAWIDHRELALPGQTSRISSPRHGVNATQIASQLPGTTLGLGANRAASNGTWQASTTFEHWFSIVHDFILPWSLQDGATGFLQSNTSQPLMIRLGRRLLRDGFALAGPHKSGSIDSNTTQTASLIRQGTMLSDVKYLQNFSRWPALNRTIIDILEGQLITLFVMVLIILVFLIREWVVQQQPNLGAPRAPAPAPAIENRPAAVEIIDDAPPEEPAIERPGNARPVADGMNDGVRDPMNLDGALLSEHTVQETPQGPDFEHDSSLSSPNSSQAQRPPMPRLALDRASELQRVLEEERTKLAEDKWPGVQTFMDYWHRGDCQPQLVLDLIHEEGRDTELAWIVNAMNRLKDTDVPNDIDVAQLGATVREQRDEIRGGNGSSDDSWQVLDGGPADQMEDSEPMATSGQLQSSVPTWLESQNLAWPPVDGPAVAEETAHLSAARTQAPIQAPVGRASDTQGGASTEQVLPEAASFDSPDAPLTFEETAVGAGNTDGRSEMEATEAQDADTHGQEPVTEDETTRDAATAAVQPAEPAQPVTFWDSLANLLWGNVELPAAEQQQVANQLEPILQPEVEHDQPLPQQPAAALQQRGGPVAQAVPGAAPPAGPDPNVAAGLLAPQDPEVLRAAREAGVNPEEIQAIEDADDLDGLIELIGLQGPLIALIQHGMVCGAIVTLVVFFGIWVPYVVGKVVLVLMSNPVTLLIKLPLRWISFVVNVAIDTCIFLAGNAFFCLDRLIRCLVIPAGWIIPGFTALQQNTAIPDTAWSFANKSIERLAKKFIVEEGFGDNDIPIFSVIAHESLVQIENKIYDATVFSYLWLESAMSTPFSLPGIVKGLASTVMNFPKYGLAWLHWEWSLLKRVVFAVMSLSQVNLFKVRLEFPERTEPFDLELIQWNTRDRILSILLGYMAFYAIGAMYVKMRHAMQNNNGVRDEALEILSQAGGVLKVILIISIEMIAFPLYCGLLLDIAMLPLFQDRTLLTRLAFAVENPLTSVFLHWIVGTCYMFHFALFVSMCRKSMRSGVLYFIRDPDDPTFHPVRDVLERNLVGQLRKIMFSALVYGALVIVCLGAVVWGLAAIPVKVLPIRWSSWDPATELPIDLIVLNFLLPLAVKALDPSSGLEAMYKWWFRRCARMLRLSHFLFNERHEDEEGTWVSEEVQSTQGPSVAPQDIYDADQRDSPATHQDTEAYDDPDVSGEQEGEDHLGPEPGRRFIREGRFVRAPASDQVRIPRSQRTFIQVDEKNNRVDGQDEPADGALHAKTSTLFQVVWLPPHFQLRIGLFIFLLWTFAAVTGLGVTIVPLIFGRLVFKTYLPANAPVNDMHAFCLGAYAVGGPVFLAIKYHESIVKAYQGMRSWITANIVSQNFVDIARKVSSSSLRALRVVYFYSFFGIVMPTLFAMIFEFYIFIPLSTSTGSEFAITERLARVSFIQNWTVGVLYLRIIGRVIHSNQDSRPARALFALVAPANNGATWWDPDIRLATRAFFLPCAALIGAALTAPLLFGYAANALYFRAATPIVRTTVYRYSYPALAASILVGFVVRALIQAYGKWRSRIRDEVYLVGERLHNFGERRVAAPAHVETSN